jgi:hypothetical protein
MNEERQEPPLGPVVVQLLKGVVEREKHPKQWEALLKLQAPVEAYLAVIGLKLEADEVEGYAFLRQAPLDEETGEALLPRLIPSRQLSYHVSLLCVLLRKKLVEADAAGGNGRVILDRTEIVELMRVFLPPQSNDARLVDTLGKQVDKVVELGFLRPLAGQEDTYEVKRILKALVNADWLSDLEQKLGAYAATEA